MAGARNYSDEEAEAIFRRAFERQAASGDGYGHDELVAAAREVGLDEEALERAAREVAVERREEDIRLTVQKRQRERWLRHFVSYAVIVGGFLGMHALGLAGAWVFWMAFGWGIGLALHSFKALRGPSEEGIQRERRRRNRKERRAAKAAARTAAKRRQAEQRRLRQQAPRPSRSAVEDELERVIEEGVGLLLGAAARKLRDATEELGRPRRADGDFARYVSSKKVSSNKASSNKVSSNEVSSSERYGARAAHEPADARSTGGPRVRVEVGADEEEIEDVEAERTAPRSRHR